MLFSGSSVIFSELRLILVKSFHVPRVFDKLLLPQFIGLDILKDPLSPFLMTEAKSSQRNPPSDGSKAVRNLLR